MLYSAKTVQLDVVIVTLDTYDDMGGALQAALGVGYWGTITAHRSDGTDMWGVELHGPGNPTPVQAKMGERLIWYPVWQRLDVVSNEEALANFTDFTPIQEGS